MVAFSTFHYFFAVALWLGIVRDVGIFCFNFSEIVLPEDHLPFYFQTFPSVAVDCANDVLCPYAKYLNKSVCWGYEANCLPQKAFKQPQCNAHHGGWVKTKKEQQDTFYRQADFGYIREQLQGMKIMCDPLFQGDSSLECSEHLRFCRGRNIMVNFTDLANRSESLRYNMDILNNGQIGGYCRLHEQRLKAECDQVSPLQSWAPELRNFVQLSERPIENNYCDVIIDKPTFIMKIDAAVNMYHHFCDFFNLYASLHVNASHPSAFSTDVNILIWETYTYYSSFSAAFKAFSRNPILDLKAFRGDVVCFKHVVFPLLPRMIFGLYYNTPIVFGCEGSGLFKAFSQFMLHRLNIPTRESILQDSPNDRRLRITLLSRETKYRRILNENALLEELKKNSSYLVQKVDYNSRLTFLKQLEITHHSDVFIGIHGAGLTHLLFLPDWAVIFELYNCEDEMCYKDLARLRGVKYMTWQKQELLMQEDEGHHPDGGAHAKFTNYAFDVQEFARLVGVAANHVQQHSAYKVLHNTTRIQSNKSQDIGTSQKKIVQTPTKNSTGSPVISDTMHPIDATHTMHYTNTTSGDQNERNQNSTHSDSDAKQDSRDKNIGTSQGDHDEL